jgi:hypothetical protein
MQELKPIQHKTAEDTPYVNLDKVNNKFEISGKSFPEDPTEFYSPILQWLENYAKDPNPFTVFEIKFSYFNSASAKQIFKIFVALSKIPTTFSITILWYYEAGDKIMRVKGEGYKNIVPISFEIKELLG